MMIMMMTTMVIMMMMMLSSFVNQLTHNSGESREGVEGVATST